MKKPVQEIPIFRPTWATIDLAALSHNYEAICKKLPAKVKVMAMVKADAYGHGAVQVSKTLEKCGVAALGVATVEEGIELRDGGISAPILVMGGLLGVGSPASKKMIDAGLTPVIHSRGVLDELESDAKAAGKKVGVHLKVDTGMSRLGVRPEVVEHITLHMKKCPHLFVEGVMTHLAEADHDDVSAEQEKRFLVCKKHIEKTLGPIKIWHIANSTAVLKGHPVSIPEAKEVWVRPGLALYGDTNGLEFSGAKLKQVMGILSRVVLLKRVPKGAKVSYGGTFKTKRPSRLAIVPIGYADGYPWSVSGKAKVLIRGRRVPVAGRVTMDMIVCDVTDIHDIEINDEVVLVGAQGKEKIGLYEVATWAGTITYEILCGISKRMPRIYVGS